MLLSYNNLKKFVKQKALLGEDPTRLKEGLILSGWDRRDVERVIFEVYSVKKKIRTGFVVFIILLIIIFSTGLFLIFGDFKNFIPDDVPPSQPPSVPVLSDSCDVIDDVELKESCYLKKIEDGFVCDNLSDEELFFCSRVLEVYLISNFES